MADLTTLAKALLAGAVVWLICLAAFLPLSAQATRGAFVYQWFPNTWSVNGVHVSYQPWLGYYSSDDQAVLDRHIRWLDFGNVDVGISSWWGQGQQSEQTRFPLALSRTAALGSPLDWALYYEKEGFGNPTVAELDSDLDYIEPNYASNPAYHRKLGKPVIFVYNADDSSCEVVNRWNTANAGRFHIVFKVFPGYLACAAVDWHQYSPASAVDHQVGFSYSISPGYRQADDADPPGGSDCGLSQTSPCPYLARDHLRFKRNVRDMVASGEPWQLVTTFNEWGEGTAVESAWEWISSGRTCHVLTPPCPGIYLYWLMRNGLDSPRTLPQSSPVITAAGDISCESASCNDDETAALLEGTALTTGDNQYETGTQTAYESYFSWPRTVKSSPGNHDPCPSSYYDEWFTPPACWYSFDLGDWHLVSLDSNNPSSSAQLSWLAADLAASTKTCKLAYWHHPRYSSGNYAPGISSSAPLWNAARDGGVDVILNGHDHNYERFGLREGMRQFIVGTGGKSHYSFGTPQPLSEVRNSTAYGVLKMTLNPTGYSWQFKPVAGQAFTDTGSGVC